MEKTHSSQTHHTPATNSRSQEPFFRRTDETSSESDFFQPSPFFNKNAATSTVISPVNSHIIQAELYSEPTGVTDPNAIIPIQDFIGYIENVESSYPDDSPLEIITRMRQMYYSGTKFTQLIPDAPNSEVRTVPTAPNYGNDFSTERTDIRERRLHRSDISEDAYSHLTARADENALGDNPSPYILLGNGEQIDVGHLLLGLDALIHPNTGAPFSVYSVPNIDPASWVADIGIAAVWMQHHEDEGEPHRDAPRRISSANFDEYYTMSAPEQDLIGDADSFGLHAIQQQNANQSLSQILRSYYLGDTPEVNNRWATFCQANGLSYTRSGNTINWSAEMIESYVTRINRFNDLYDAGTLGAVGATIVSPFFEPSRGNWRYTRISFTRFLVFVKRELERELNNQ